MSQTPENEKRLFVFSEDTSSREDWNPFYCLFVSVIGADFNDPLFSDPIRYDPQNYLVSDESESVDEGKIVDDWMKAVKAKFPTADVELLNTATGIELVEN